MNEQDKKYLRIWFWSGAGLVFLILIIGGITRLTGSGLSMTEWKPIMGAIPPLNEAQWQDAFEQYKQYPEYQQRNRGMSLGEFKTIFFWEYLHRMAGRLIGIVFIVPFAWFVAKKKLTPKWLKRSLWLLALGSAQALMGWYMVQSGLVDLPYVSPYRLTAHLLLAFVIFGYCLWYAMELTPLRKTDEPRHTELKKWLWVLLVLIILQTAWGALTAGLNAGHIYNTFPKMFQYWIPNEIMMLEPWYQNLTENPTTVQWIHRILGTLIGVLAIAYWARLFTITSSWTAKKWGLKLLIMVLIQYLLGVVTLITHVHVHVAVSHQAGAMLLFGILIGNLAIFHKHIIQNQN